MSLLTREVVPSNVVNDQDHGAIVTIVCAFGLTTMAIFLCIRLLIRWPWQNLVGKDDIAVAVASAFGIIQTIVVLSGVRVGLGKSSTILSTESSLRVKKMIFASDLLYVWALFSSKLAVCVLITRLCIARKHIKCANILTCACMGFGVMSMFIIGLRQRTSDPWNGEPATGLSTLDRWIVIEVFACSIDIVIALSPVALVWDLQMKQSNKVWVILGFAARLPTIPLAILRLVSLSRSLTSEELVFDHATSEIFTQIELCFSVISATIPCLRIFMQSVNTGLLGMTTFDESSADRSKASYLASRSGNFGAGQSHNKPNNGKSRVDAGGQNTPESIELQERNFYGENHSNAVAGSDKISVASDNSERAIIVRQTVDVRYD